MQPPRLPRIAFDMNPQSSVKVGGVGEGKEKGVEVRDKVRVTCELPPACTRAQPSIFLQGRKQTDNIETTT